MPSNKLTTAQNNYLSTIIGNLKNNGNAEIILKGTKLKECSCDKHNRLLKNNTRSKIEQAIADHVTSNVINKNKAITFLSVGSGNLLQDFLLIVKLVRAGARDINLTMVEPFSNDEVYKSFSDEIEILKKVFPDLEINHRIYKSLDAVETEKFDVVYAIDYDDYLSYDDYSSRKLHERAGIFREKIKPVKNDANNNSSESIKSEDNQHETKITADIKHNNNSELSETFNIPLEKSSDHKSEYEDPEEKRRRLLLDEEESVDKESLDIVYGTYNSLMYKSPSAYTPKEEEPKHEERPDPYTATMALIKATTMLRDDESETQLALISKGNDVFSLIATKLKLPQNNDYPMLAAQMPNTNEISAFYIYANICHLINNIQYFIDANKPVIINEKIIQDDDDRELVKQYLAKNNIHYQFMDEDTFHQSVDYRKNGLLVVVDYAFFRKNDEKIIADEFNKKNVFVARLDFHTFVVNRFKNKPSRLVLFPSPEKAKRLVLNKLNDNQLTKIKEIDRSIMRSLVEFDIESQKKQYIHRLKGKLETLDPEIKKHFAYYILFEKPDHLLKKERHPFRTNAYSIQTRSIHQAVSLLLGKDIEIISKKILVNDVELNRHINNVTKPVKSEPSKTGYRR